MREDVAAKLAVAGQILSDQTELAIAQNDLEGVLKISGHPSWRFLNWSKTEDYSVDQIKTYFMQEVFRRGVLVLSTHNVNLAHTPKLVGKISNAYQEVFSELNRALMNKTLDKELAVSPLKPLFKVR